MIVRRMGAAGARSLHTIIKQAFRRDLQQTFFADPWPPSPRSLLASSRTRPLEPYPMNAYMRLPMCTLAMEWELVVVLPPTGHLTDVLRFAFRFVLLSLV